MAHSLRSNSEIYLIGFERFQILGSKLPSHKDVLQVFFHNRRTLKLSERESFKLAVKESTIFWEKAIIPIRKEQRQIEKLEKVYQRWLSLSKSKKKDGKKHLANEESFKNDLNQLFDIAHGDAMDMLDDEGKIFLKQHRYEKREGCILGVDEKATRKEKRTQERLDAENERKRRYEASKSSTGLERFSWFLLVICDYQI